MPYSDFTLKKVKDEFKVKVLENKDLFSHCSEIAISAYLATTLSYNVPLALAVGTEKCRSDKIVGILVGMVNQDV